MWRTQPANALHLRRPILFRAGSTGPVRSFRSKHISHPHANVVSSDAFARGLIRSDTDYSVYTRPRSSAPRENDAPIRLGMQGLDLAFYKGRSRYHTRYDTVPYTAGGEKSLWSMMEVAKGSGIELLNAYDTEVDQGGVGDGDAPVFFDCEHLHCLAARECCSCSIYFFSVQINRVCVSDYQFVDVQYRRSRRFSNRTCLACYLEACYNCQTARDWEPSKVQGATFSVFQS